MHRPSRSLVCLAAACLAAAALLAGSANAQPRRGDDPPPILERHPLNNTDRTLIARIRLRGVKTQALPDESVARTNFIAVEKMTVAFPILNETSMSVTYPDRAEAFVRFAGDVLDDQPRTVTGYQGPTSLLALDTGPARAKLVTAEARIPMTSYETRIDEERALTVPRLPEDAELPAAVAANLDPQLFVEVGAEPIQGLLDAWIGTGPKRDPRNVKPYILAKFLAARVVEHYMPSEGPWAFVDREETGRRGRPLRPLNETAYPNGLLVRGAAHAAVHGEGSPLDMANLLCALYRTAGLPARVVVGVNVPLDRAAAPGGFVQLPDVRAWVEFHLYDPARDEHVWIPVDIVAQRAFSSKAPDLDRPWEYFGKNLDFDDVVPVAFHWHPPTYLGNSGPPVIWGWVAEPGLPVADQELYLDATSTPTTVETQDRDRRTKRGN